MWTCHPCCSTVHHSQNPSALQYLSTGKGATMDSSRVLRDTQTRYGCHWDSGEFRAGLNGECSGQPCTARCCEKCADTAGSNHSSRACQSGDSLHCLGLARGRYRGWYPSQHPEHPEAPHREETRCFLHFGTSAPLDRRYHPFRASMARSHPPEGQGCLHTRIEAQFRTIPCCCHHSRAGRSTPLGGYCPHNNTYASVASHQHRMQGCR